MKDRNRRYSDTLEAGLAEQVSAIEARRGGDNFRTHGFASVTDGNEEWYEAVRGASRTWSVVEYRRTAGIYPGKDNKFSEEKALTRNVLFRNACFFDALHACAEFEVSAGAQKDILKLAEDGKLGKEHYEAYAKAEGIVFDLRNNMPIPVANGEILADSCTLANDALETVKFSKGNAKAIEPKEISADAIFNGSSMLPALSSNSLPVPASQGRMVNVEKKNHARLAKAAKLSDKFALAVRKNFSTLSADCGGPDMFDISPTAMVVAKTGLGSAAGAFAVGVLCPPLAIPAVATIFIGGGLGAVATFVALMGSLVEGRNPIKSAMTYGWVRPGKAFDRELDKFQASLERDLRTLEQKEELGVLIKKVRIGVMTLSARHAFKRATEAGFFKAPFANMVLERRLRKLKSTARESGLMSDVEIARLTEGLQQEARSSRFEEALTYAIECQMYEVKHFVERVNGQEAALASQPKALTYCGSTGPKP